MTPQNLDPRIEAVLGVTEGFVFLARELARIAANQIPAKPGRRRGATVRPGPRTPMWNTLVKEVRPHLSGYGEKINLGRWLGVPPQRIHEYFVAGTAAPDAERTLLIVHWLALRRNGMRVG